MRNLRERRNSQVNKQKSEIPGREAKLLGRETVTHITEVS